MQSYSTVFGLELLCWHSRCLHRSFEGMQSHHCVSAVKSPSGLDRRQQRERDHLGEEEKQLLVARVSRRHRWEEGQPWKTVRSVQGVSLQVLCHSLAWQSVQRCRWDDVHV